MRKNDREPARAGEQGFALVLALLALLLLTFLGLTLAVTTSTELQIATNYRWSQQAVYAAEAGIEAGKAALRGVAWNQIAPNVRMTGPNPTNWTGAGPAGDPSGGWSYNSPVNGLARRNFEGGSCDTKGNGMGYGVVLDEGAGGDAGQVYQYVSTVFNTRVTGAFTLWVRRPLLYRPDGTISDWGKAGPLPGGGNIPRDDNDNLILVAEGVAPFSAGGANTSLAQARAVHVIEVAVSHVGSVAEMECDTSRGGQQGLGPEGANFGGCRKLTANALQDAMRGAGGTRGGLSEYTGTR